VAKATITFEDIDADNASLVIDWGPGGYDETSGAHRLAGTISGSIERTGPVEDIHADDVNQGTDGSEGGTHD
jgi:hypothetical protein